MEQELREPASCCHIRTARGKLDLRRVAKADADYLASLRALITAVVPRVFP